MSTRAVLEHLREGQVLDDVELSRAEAVALNASQLVSVQPAASGWKVTAAHAVGTVRCGDLIVRVRPKVGTLQVLRLLARAYGLDLLRIDQGLVDVADDTDLSAVLAVLFTEEAAHALADGPLRGYRTEDQTLPVLRGRLRMRDQGLRRFGVLVPMEVTVDEWTTDTGENRLIRAATRRLLTLPGLPGSIVGRLRHLDRLLADVWLAPRGMPLEPWTATRLNTRLHRLLHLADLILENASVEQRVGEVDVRGFVLSMWQLFERLVTRLLTEQASGVSVVAQRQLRLDQLGRLDIKPDILVYDGADCVAVADTKYKLLDENGRFPNADAYQLATYCLRLGLDTAHLIYAAGEPRPEPYEIVGTGVRLVVHSIDLAAPLHVLWKQAGTTLAAFLGAQRAGNSSESAANVIGAAV